MFAKLVGEGYERPNADNEVPLDVNYAKVTEWLVRWFAQCVHIQQTIQRCINGDQMLR